jgi:hypothetical protein
VNQKLAQAAKAILAALIAGLTALGAYLTQTTNLSDITAGQWVFAAIAALVALGGVYGIQNAPPNS